eukprot:10193001-Prorocentrum_lima.AAC.1
MTSSLVGSEMCIRDRDLPCHRSIVDARDGTEVLIHSPMLCLAHNHAPVSYTHLTLPTICSV